MKISIASGKGGTGKTTIATNLALSLRNCQFIDCDVEEPNAHIFLKPIFQKTENVNVDVPLINAEKCTNCGICSEACQFNALIQLPEHVVFFADLCMSCNACKELCPQNAISMRKNEIGKINLGKTKQDIEFINGYLNIGSPRAIPIIDAVKSHINPSTITILDAPPGNSCPVIETIYETDFCALVTEPTPFGLWDLGIAVEVTKKLGIPTGVIINRKGLGFDKEIEKFCGKENIPILMEIPYERLIAKAYSKGIPLVEFNNTWREKFQELFLRIKDLVENNG